ncbi:MAG: SDR family oxidoreductase [Spirochaetaceae bacterium]|nr:SDR family oxidoreductase [Spirochaetaceae bacterium]
MRFDGKAALITGGGSGIGRATAAAFAQEGARVAVADANRQGAEETAHAIEAAGGQALALEADVTVPDAVEAMTQAVVDAYGQLDCALNAAGVGGEGTPLLELSWERWQHTIRVNLSGVFLCVQQQLRHMVPAGSGAICNVASIWGLAGTGADGMIGERQPAYNASKHGVVGLTKCAALDYASAGVRVNAVCPGHIETPMTGFYREHPERKAHLLRAYPGGRMGQPDEIAQTVLWLCSDAASFVTGVAFPVDGGYLAQ